MGCCRETIWYLYMFKAFNQEAEGKGKGLNCHWRKAVVTHVSQDEKCGYICGHPKSFFFNLFS